jgi:nickel/cobalt transporter (NicO) family protein
VKVKVRVKVKVESERGNRRDGGAGEVSFAAPSHAHPPFTLTLTFTFPLPSPSPFHSHSHFHFHFHFHSHAHSHFPGFTFDSAQPPVLADVSLMQSTVLTTVAATGFTVAFLHAAIPTHWLPFVLVARARKWGRAKTIAVTTVAGLGHVALTGLLGLLIAWFGFQLDEHIGELFPWVAGGLLLAFAGFYFWRQWTGTGICHHHAPGSHHHPGEHCGHEKENSHWQEELKGSPLVSSTAGEWAAIGGLFVMLTLSPCEGFLPVYLSGVQFGWRGFVVLSVILAVATLAGMTLFTWLALVGFERFRLKTFERYEAGLLGTLFAVLGVLLIFLERH